MASSDAAHPLRLKSTPIEIVTYFANLHGPHARRASRCYQLLRSVPTTNKILKRALGIEDGNAASAGDSECVSEELMRLSLRRR